MTDVVPYSPPAPRVWIELMEPAARLADAVARTEFVPASLRGNTAAITAAILYGDEVGLSPMQSLAKVHVIDGRPALSAEAQRALVLAAGHEMWIEESTNTRVTWAGRRHGSDQVSRITWTLDDAKKAGLDGRKNWRSYPRAMLSARASAELARAVFADAIGGLMAVEELEDPEFVEGSEASTTEPAARTVRKAKRPGRKAVEAPAVKDGAPKAPAQLPALPGQEPVATSPAAAEVVEPAGTAEVTAAPTSTPITDAQDEAITKQRASTVAMWCNDAGFTSDDDRHAFLAAYSQGKWASSYDVGPDDLGGLRNAIRKVQSGELVMRDGALVKASDHLVSTTAGEPPLVPDGEEF